MRNRHSIPELFPRGKGEGFIHVHHLKPLAQIGEQYELDPINDLRPVCPNCHAMLHRASPALRHRTAGR